MKNITELDIKKMWINGTSDYVGKQDLTLSELCRGYQLASELTQNSAQAKSIFINAIKIRIDEISK